jgi:hypothetical protein
LALSLSDSSLSSSSRLCSPDVSASYVGTPVSGEEGEGGVSLELCQHRLSDPKYGAPLSRPLLHRNLTGGKILLTGMNHNVTGLIG